MASSTTSTGSTTSFTGAISGLDSAGIIQAMLTAERAPLTRISSQRTTLKGAQSAYGQLRKMLATLQAAAEAFTKSSAGSSRLASSSATSILTAAAAAGTVPGSYTVKVDHLATGTVATSTAPIGTAITAGDLAASLSALRLPGTVTAGSVGMVVDGTIVQAAIGAPAATSLGDALTSIASSIQAQLRAGGDASATVAATVVDNKVQFNIAGAASTHSVSFGVSGSTSNAMGILGLTGVSSSVGVGATAISGKSSLGVASTSSKLDLAGLTGLVSGAGKLAINGVVINYDTTTDALSDVVSRINASAAGVTASLDRSNDKLLLTSRTGGAGPISIADTTGNLGAALKLAPGTTNAQVLGTQAMVTVDGRAYTADTNRVSTAIEGVSLTLLAEGTSTVTVSPDTGSVQAALSQLVNAYNDLADNLEAMTANTPNSTKGSLASQSEVRTLALSLRQSMLSLSSSSGTYGSLADIGVTSGALGSKVGTTTRLQVNASKLSSALQSDPAAVATLVDGATGVFGQIATSLKSWTTTAGRIDKNLDSISSQLKDLDTREQQINDRVALRQTALEAKFAAMESTLAAMQTTTSSITNQVSQMNKSNG